MSRKTLVRLSVIFALTAVFLFFFLRSVDWAEVGRFLKGMNPWWAIVAVGVTPLHLFTRGWRWKYLLHHEKRDVRFSSLWMGNAVGFTVTFILPGRVGELIKPIYVARREGMRTGFAIGTVVVERIFDIFTMCALLGGFLLLRPHSAVGASVPAEKFAPLYLWGILGTVLAFVLLLLCLLFFFYKEKALRVSAKVLFFLPHGIKDRVLHLLHELIDGLKIFHNLGDFVAYILLGFVVWLNILFQYWIYFLAFRYPLPFFSLIPYLFLVAIGASIPTPGMAGGYHYFSKLGLVTFLGMAASQAVGFTIVVHAVQLVVTCIIGYTILWKEGLSLFQLRRMGANDKP